MSARHRILTTGNAFLIAGMAAGSAQAAPIDYEIVSSSGPGIQNPLCPGFTGIVSGGFVTPGFQYVYDNRPWAGGWEGAANGHAFIEVYAICANMGASSQYEIVSASGTGTQNALCPGSKKVLGGGFEILSPHGIHESRPETGGTGWRATAQDNAFIKVFAACANVDSSYEIASVSGAGTQNPPCSGGRKVLGGGARVPSFQYLHENRPAAGGMGWRATAASNAFVEAYAICADVPAGVPGEIPVLTLGKISTTTLG